MKAICAGTLVLRALPLGAKTERTCWSVRALALLLLIVAACGVAGGALAEGEPLFTFAQLAHTYVTTQTNLPPQRQFISASLDRLKTTLEVVNRQKPEFVVVTGNLTWFGDDKDYADLKAALQPLQAPLYAAPGEQDLPEGSAERFRQFFARDPFYSFDYQGCHLVIVGHFPPEGLKGFVDWLEADLERAKESVQTLVCGYPFPPSAHVTNPSPEAVRLRDLIRKHRVTAWLGGPHPYGPLVEQPEGLPLIALPSVGWAPVMFTHALIKVYPDRVVVALTPLRHDLLQELTLPNPKSGVTPPPPGEFPFLADYREDLAQKPLLTFVQLSDPQLDDGSVEAVKDSYVNAPQITQQAIQEVNALDPPPAFVAITGDLTNKSTDPEWQQYVGLVKTLRGPVYHLPGNHDIDQILEEKPPQQTLTRFQNHTASPPYQSWPAGEAYFIALDSSRYDVDEPQRAWLRGELEKSRNHRYVFVLAHHPIDLQVGNTVTEGRDEVERMLREYQVCGYLCGHRHFYAYAPLGEMLHVVCNDLCWPGDNGYLIYHLFPDRFVACYKAVGQPRYWRVTFRNPRRPPEQAPGDGPEKLTP